MSATVIHADNLRALEDFAAEPPAFALAYLDPPFFTQKTWSTADGEVAFEDRWKSLEEYVATITEVARAAWLQLIPEGSVVVHVDPTTSHYLKVALDGQLGAKCFASEIIWRYRRWPTPTRNFQAMHDVLLRYVRDPKAEPRWNQLYEPLSPKTVETWGTKKQRAVWDPKVEGSKSLRSRRRCSSTGEEESPGVPLCDVWDIGIVPRVSHERTGYPTQKPEALLERLILSCTNEGDSVLDPYCGSGTTLAVAHRLGRHGVGIDRSDVAVRYARERLAPLLAQRNLFADVTARNGGGG